MHCWSVTIFWFGPALLLQTRLTRGMSERDAEAALLMTV